MARPKGSGRGLVVIALRIEPEIYERLLARSEGASIAETTRQLLRASLEYEGDIKPISAADAGYREGLRRGRAEFHQVFKEVWQRVMK